MEFVNSKNFNKELTKVLLLANKGELPKGNMDLEYLDFEAKIKFCIRFLTSFEVKSATYRILYWEEDTVMIESFLKPLSFTNVYTKKKYKGKSVPGEIYIDESSINRDLLYFLLKSHFNFEIGEAKGFNIRVQVCLNFIDYKLFVDIYDDRGFNIYYSIQ